MLAPDVAVSVDSLLNVDAAALDDAELKAVLCEFALARARLDAAEAAVIAEFDQRAGFVVDGR